MITPKKLSAFSDPPSARPNRLEFMGELKADR
jgi:hypothetical protein